MAETDSKYADSLISQDVINRLMKEAEELGPDALPENSAADLADGDVVSQDDIDSILNSISPKEEDPVDEEPELISQEDIDALLEGNLKKTEPSPEPEKDVDDDTADLDLVTAEDIEKLLGAESNTDRADVDDVDETGDDLEQISADDIDVLLSGTELNGGDGDDIPLGEDADDSLISQEDIDALLSSSLKPENPSKEPPPAEEEMKTPDAGNDAPVAEPAAEADVPDEAQMPAGEEEDAGLISQDDIDRLLAGDDESQDVSVDDSDGNLISQDDIDNLIKGHIEDEDEGEGEGETLITQDDIDKLLKMPEPAGIDESVAEESLEEMDQLVSQEDIDKLLNADFDEMDSDLSDSVDANTSDQVVLEKSMESIDDTGAKEKPKKNVRRIVVSCVATALVLIVTAVSWIMFSGDSQNVVEEIPVAEVISEEVPDLPEEIPAEVKEYVEVTMNDFVVPAPAAMKGTAYIYVNMTIEISDVSSNPIKDYEPFFRNIIYEVLNKALVLQSESRIVEADLKRMIKEALNDSLSEGSIAKIDFSEFKLG